MAIQTDRKALESLKRTFSKRLRASRIAAGMSQSQAAMTLRHRGITQVSLAEDGTRLPPIHDIVKYADLYCVPVDFLLGRIDDPIAEADEHSNGLMVRAVAHAIGEAFEQFTRATAEHVSVALSEQRQDRKDLKALMELVQEQAAALERVKELNPQYEDLRGASKLESLVKYMTSIVAKAEERIRREQRQFEIIDKALRLEKAEERIEQFALSFQVSGPGSEGRSQESEGQGSLAP